MLLKTISDFAFSHVNVISFLNVHVVFT